MTDTTTFKFLPLTLSIETQGGVSTALVRRGTPLPTKRTKRFSTTVENQQTVAVRVHLGESPISANNALVAQCELTDIPKARRGDPEIDVTFEVDEECGIKITATEKKSGKTISSKVENVSVDLAPEKVKGMIEKADRSRRQDEELAQRIEVRNKANQLLHRAEKYLQEQQGYALATSTDEEMEEAVASLGLSLQDDDVSAMRDNTERLERLLPKTSFADLGDLFGGGMFHSMFGPSAVGRSQAQKRSAGKAPAGSASGPGREKAEPPKSEQIAESKKGLFLAGQHFDAKRLVSDIFAQAKREIILIDGYVGEDVLNLLTGKRVGVHVKLLTGKVSAALLTLARDFNRQYKGLAIRSSNAFHDRFVMIDARGFYHFGASLEHLGNRTFMFSKIEEPAMIEALQRQWQQVWGRAKQVL